MEKLQGLQLKEAAMNKVIAPPKVFLVLSKSERLKINKEIFDASEVGLLWLEKIRRFCSFSGRNIVSMSKKKFGAGYKDQMIWMANVLLENCLQKGTVQPVDQSILNAALYCSAFLSEQQLKKLDEHCDCLEAWLINCNTKKLVPAVISVDYKGQSAHLFEEVGKKGIVIICPNPFSKYTITVYSILKKLGVNVSAIVLRDFTFQRFKQEFHRDGARLIYKIWRKLILRKNENPIETDVSVNKVCQRVAGVASDIRKIATADNVPIIKLKAFKNVPSALVNLAPSIAIFTGGGMIGKDFIEAFPEGIINTHMGSLPHHKGMDVVQAPILEGHFKDVAFTTHLMVAGLDEGPILQKFVFNSDHYPKLGALRNEMSAIAPLIAVDSALGRLSGRITPQEQPNLGKQYYFVHPRLMSFMGTVFYKRYKGQKQSELVEVVDTFFAPFKC